MHARSPYQTPMLLDERQAAAALGLTPRTLQSWRHRGGENAIPFVRISTRCIRYRPEDLRKWAAERLRTTPSRLITAEPHNDELEPAQ